MPIPASTLLLREEKENQLQIPTFMILSFRALRTTLFSLSLFAISLLSASVARWKSPRAKNSQFKVSPSACEGGAVSKPDFLLLLLSYQEKVLEVFFASLTK